MTFGALNAAFDQPFVGLRLLQQRDYASRAQPTAVTRLYPSKGGPNPHNPHSLTTPRPHTASPGEVFPYLATFPT
ncbi:unnamed protein product [Danaus chrysippus]|uniref:(African queen) hypothetical protein n=1 Tax=Danaus chrysippus TaxID=151541 RepID=A0A8J2M7W4_9NEOP|nr:unnamed protein product [Danaus chrysippus]